MFADDFDLHNVFVVTKNKNGDSCISLVDLGRNKLVSHGFIGPLMSVEVCSLTTFEIGISGKGFLRRLKAQDGVWTVEERIPKKLQNMDIISHHWILGDRIVAVTEHSFYIIE